MEASRRVAVVTGALGGIGRSICSELREKHGYYVIGAATWHSNEDARRRMLTCCKAHTAG